MRNSALSALLLASLATAGLAAPSVTSSDGRLALTSSQVRRVLEREGAVWRTTLLSRADGSNALAVQSEEFLIRLMDGTELTISDYRAEADPQLSEANEEARAAIRYVPARELPKGAPTAVTVEYRLKDEPYLRKSLRLAMPAGGAVDLVQVERLRTHLPCAHGGRGEPVFVDGCWFLGLEYPGADNTARDGLVALTHYPGLAKQDPAGREWFIQSKTAVIGVGAKGDPIELAFSDYIDTIRRPHRNFLQYNSWYDWRGDELSLKNMVETFEGFKRNLLDPYGLKMDAFVPDDGYQNYQSIWVPRANLYPDGFGPLKEALEARGTRFGIWMPLNGTNLDTNWGAQQGYEKSNQGAFYCLVGPKYNAAIREATKRIITQGNLAYYKHDFNTLRCTAEGHGHLPDDRHGHEANLDAELELLAYERSLQPDIFLNITSSVWLSCWWLQHADSIWMCAGDFGYDKTWPQLSPREWDMSYRDAHFYQVYHRGHHLVPVSAMMTHGIIHGRHCKLGGNEETLREWSDMVVLYYGRGVQLKELYITPGMVPPDWWQVLGEATRWAVEQAPLLDNTVMVGGDPRKGEVYGYAHWLGEKGITVLRNPDVQERAVRIPFDKTVRFRGLPGRSYRGRVIYPFVEDLPTRFISGRPAQLAVPGCSVMVYELSRGEPIPIRPASVPALEGATANVTLDNAGRGLLSAHVPVPDEDMQRCDLYLLVRGAGKGVDFVSISLNGQPAGTRRANSDGWLLHSLDLRALRGKVVDVMATLPGSDERPFSAPAVRVSVWLVADRPVASHLSFSERPSGEGGEHQGRLTEHLPLAVSQDFRRQTVQLLPETRLERAQPERHLTEADLRTIKAAKLRIRVFDVNSEPQYQGKFIYLNGEKLAPIPVNRGELSAWDEHVIDLKPDQFGLLKPQNRLYLDNAGGDCYKFSDLTIAVQLPDGTWVESSTDDKIRSSVDNWAYTEGEVFEGGRSGEATLQFR